MGGSLARKLVRLGELVIYSFNVVASYILTGVLTALSILVAVLTIWELWTPAKAIADDLAARHF